jgi:transposase
MVSKSASRKPRQQKVPSKITKEQREELLLELRRLRSLFQEIVDFYSVRGSAMIQRLVENVEAMGLEDSDLELTSEQYDQVISSIRRLDVKPKKGRRKDLKSIENLVEEIEDILT